MALATTILTRWKQFDSSQQREFIALLLERFGPDRERLAKAIDGYQSDPGSRTLLELHNAAEPRRQELIRRLNLAPNGIATLVRMREAILKLKADQPDFEAVDADFAHLFSSWFNRGFLVLRPISWSTPADILEKSYTMRLFITLVDGMNCDAVSRRKTGDVSPSFIRNWSTIHLSLWRLR